MAITSLGQARSWPPADAARLNSADHRDINNLIADRIENAPDQDEYSTRTNQALVANDAGNGYTTADQATATKFGGKPVRNFKPYVVPSSTSVILTDNDHDGCILVVTNSSPATVTISVSGDPSTGCSSPFRCEVRNHGTSTVTITFSSVTNKNPSSHTKVQANRGAVLTLIGTDVWFDGYTSA